MDQEEFYPTGELTNAGMQIFLCEVDACLKKFDRNEINLKPKPKTHGKKTKNAAAQYNRRSEEDHRRRLLTPPESSRQFKSERYH